MTKSELQTEYVEEGRQRLYELLKAGLSEESSQVRAVIFGHGLDKRDRNTVKSLLAVEDFKADDRVYPVQVAC